MTKHDVKHDTLAHIQAGGLGVWTKGCPACEEPGFKAGSRAGQIFALVLVGGLIFMSFVAALLPTEFGPWWWDPMQILTALIFAFWIGRWSVRR